MTDEFQTPAPDEDPEPVDPVAEEESPEGPSDFTSGEGLVALGGIVILAVWIIFEVIAKDYVVATLAMCWHYLPLSFPG
jgi:hypothetical protein